MRRHLIPIFLLTTGCLVATPAYTARPEEPRRQKTVYMSDVITRQIAHYLKKEEVQCLVFGGDELVGAQHDETIVVDDPVLISRFVLALHSAVGPGPHFSPDGEEIIDVRHGPTAQDNAYIRVYRKQTLPPLLNQPDFAQLDKQFILSRNHKYGKKERGEYLQFTFFPNTLELAFGPSFFSCLRALGKYQVEQIRRTAREVKGKVVAFRCVTDLDDQQGIEGRVTDPARVAAFVEALTQVDERAYQWLVKWNPIRRTNNTPAHPIIELELRDGKKLPLILLLSELQRDSNRNPDWLKLLHRSLQESHSASPKSSAGQVQ